MTQQRNAKEEKTIGSLKPLELAEILVPATREDEYCEKEGYCVSYDSLTGNPFKFKSVPESFVLQPLDKHYSKLTQNVLLISLADDLRFSFCSATTDNPVFVGDYELRSNRKRFRFVCR